MTGKKKFFIGCTSFVLAVVVIVGAVLIWLVTGPDGGVRLSNTMEEYALKYIEKHRILDASEELVAYYDVTMSLKSTECAILTTKRIIYHKNGRNDSIELKDIDDIRNRKEGIMGQAFEITSTGGKMMTIEIAAMNDADTFKSALMNAWKQARNSEDKDKKETPP